MQEFRFQPNQIDFLSTDCITTIILESFFNLFYLSTLASGPAAMHFRPILLLHCPRPLPPVHSGVTPHQCTPMSEQRWPSPELGGRVFRHQHREAPSAERCWPPRLWLLDLGQYVSNLRACFVWVEGEGDSCVTFHNLYPFQMLTSSHSDRSQREMLINEPDWEDGHSVTHVYYTAIKWLSKPHCVRVSAYATWWKWRSIGSYSDFSDCIWNVLFNEKEKEQRGCGRVFWW